MSFDSIENHIHKIRGMPIMLDFHLAILYGVETKRLNEQVRRNIKRFPDSFRFQLSQEEWKFIRAEKPMEPGESVVLRSQFATTKRRTLPFAFTEHGVSMLSSVLNSEQAILVSIQIIQAFVAMRRTLHSLDNVIRRMDHLELRQLATNTRLEAVLKELEKGEAPSQGVFFEGQLFDAHVFVSRLIKDARREIILVDNYVDETTLLLLSKRAPKVRCIIHTRLRPDFCSDLQKHNLQYTAIEVVQHTSSHDRFLIIDNRLYHIGASLKDLGKKCFAFSRMDDLLPDIRVKLLKQ